MKIGELSQHCGVSIRMLRHYESLGLLKPARTAAKYRDYDERAPDIVAHITALNAAGVRLETIRSLLPCAREGGPDFELCDTLRERLQETLVGLDARIATLSRNRQALQRLLSTAK